MTFGSPATTNRNNGHDATGAVLTWKPGNNGNANELINIDKVRVGSKETGQIFEIPEVLLKTVLADSDEALDFAQAIHHCMEFEMWEMLAEIYSLLVLKASVEGRARVEFLQGITGVLLSNINKKQSNLVNKKDGERDKGMYNGPPTS